MAFIFEFLAVSRAFRVALLHILWLFLDITSRGSASSPTVVQFLEVVRAHTLILASKPHAMVLRLLPNIHHVSGLVSALTLQTVVDHCCLVKAVDCRALYSQSALFTR